MSTRKGAVLGALLLLIFGLPGALSAQTTFATITGTVTDPTGAVVPNAMIAATHVSTNTETTTESNDSGVYLLGALKGGAYTLRVQHSGFKEFVVQNLVLAARDYRRIDIHMQLGEQKDSVEVTGGATLIETETARIAGTKSADLLKVLPQNWFRFASGFVALAPGASSNNEEGGFRFADSKDNQSQFTVDGTTTNDGVSSFIGPQASYFESVQELKVGTANAGAEYGSLGQFTLISKSGTNRFHGSLFDYYVTPLFRARNPFATAREPGINHFPGFSAGGPVFIPKIYNGRNKTFFFTSYETSRGSSQTTFQNPTVPLAAWRQGDFSGVNTVIRDPLTGQPFPGNRIPQGRLNQVSVKIQDRFYPLPNFGDTSTFNTQNYRQNSVSSWNPVSLFVVRGDHKISERDNIYGRLTWTRGLNRFFQGNLPAIGRPEVSQRDTRSATGSYSHTFSANLLNEFRYGLVYNNFPFHGNIQGKPLVEELGLVGLAPNLPDISGLLKVSFNNLPLQGISQRDYEDPGFRNFVNEFSDHVSWLRGRHTFKFGGALTRVTWSDFSAPSCLFGCVTFSNRFTGFTYADFLLGYPTTAARAFPPLRVERKRSQYDFYVNDDFKVSRKLTLNLGLRYEHHPYWTEENGLSSLFDVDSGKVVVPDGSLSRVSPLFPRDFVDVVEAGNRGFAGKTLINNDKNNFAPRLGVAYRPWGDNTVFRGGFGIYFDGAPRDINFGGEPYVLNEPAFTNPLANPAVIFPRVFPASGPDQRITEVSLPSAVNPRLKIPYSLQYNFTIEHSHWGTGFRLSYIGTAGRQGEYGYDINAPVPDARPFIAKPRRFPAYSTINYLTNGANHQYNAFSAQAERSLSRGLYFQTFWTWARDIGDSPAGGRYGALENPFDRRRERAVATDVPSHRFVANFLYQFPFGKGRRYLAQDSRALDLLVGGWEISGLFAAQTGRFLTPEWCGPDPAGTAFSGSIDPAEVCIRPDQLRDPNLPGAEQTLQRYFDPGAFGPPQLGRFGTSARGVIKGPGTNIWNAVFAKTFSFQEGGARLRLELMARNLFNHPNYSNPDTCINCGSPGQISSAFGTSFDFAQWRQLRLGVRLEW